jgi:16S rRNA (adenine1518-N6/adenine1519-N6)-dimethyltransferase|tara:strand:- start:1182 stop:1973 length:792 start_codon:yes stop_codon:yes gene_type:complete
MKILPKKSLGQNFLMDINIINKIIDIGDINEKDYVLEVGPGTGNLTREIIKKQPKKIFLIEKDKFLYRNLKKKFKNKINIFNEDILKVNEKNLSNKKLIVFGNLPYNISTQILAKWILNCNPNFWYKKLILMFQKDVAERITAKTNTSNYGRLSIISNWKLKITKHFDVSKNCFYPKPRVESSVLSFVPETKYIKFQNAENLELVTRIFFSQKRKMINKPIKQLFNNRSEILKKLKMNFDLRPQNLSKEIYFEITKEYENLTN